MAHASPPDLPRHLLQRLASAEEMRQMDAHAIEALGLPGRVLMENAARAVADRVAALLADAPGPVVVCCGAGNNGGDGYAAARLLANRGLPVTVLRAGEPAGGDALANAQAWAHFGETVDAAAQPERARALLGAAAAIVDALFGTGLSRAVSGAPAALIDAVNAAAAESGAPVVAVDLPSGVNSDTGQVLGRAVRCTHTVTFQALKPGCCQFPGAGLAGALELAAVSIPPRWPAGAAAAWRLEQAFAAALLPARPAEGHKGTFGHLLTVCGSSGMGGAALMASIAGLKVGTGLVTAGVPRALRDRFLTAAPELMTLAAEDGPEGHFAPAHAPALLEAAAERSAVVLGCGVGRREETGAFVQRLLADVRQPLLVDADGLYHLQPRQLKARKGPTVITPHPGELARLAGLEREAVGADRLGVTRRLAAEWNVVLVLKGAGTVIADPSGEAFVNPTGDAGLASGGTGDVLSGIVGGLLAQGLAPLPAALLGVYLHGLARDCQRERVTSAYFTAADLIAGINPALQRLGAP
jgi:ADP-dependent NAD(P)H-hydrate dehydratase / NAD(P)H-hydrate epimerase